MIPSTSNLFDLAFQLWATYHRYAYELQKVTDERHEELLQLFLAQTLQRAYICPFTF